MNNLFDVTGKVAIVTGGSRGIGKMITLGLVIHGVKTYITARREQALQECASEINQAVGSELCCPVVADLSTMEGIKGFAAQISARESQIDILINNAGATWGEDFEQFPEAGWDKVMNLNAKAPFFVTQQLLPQLKAAASKEDPARVINIASINALNNPDMNNYSYAASKAAVVQMTRHLASDLVSQGININAIAPGFFQSKMTEFMINEENPSSFENIMIPMQRKGNADDITGTVIYLASKASAWVTGHTLVLDGGVIAASTYGNLQDV